MTIVEPTAQDYSAIDALLAAAFGSDNDSHVMEIDLVRGMRRADDMALELIDRRADTIIGHLAFSPMQGGGRFLRACAIVRIAKLATAGRGRCPGAPRVEPGTRAGVECRVCAWRSCLLHPFRI